MRYLIVLLVILGGAGVPVQIAANNRLGKVVGAPALSITLAFLVGTVGMVLLTVSGVLGRGHLAGAASAPWWAWGGGLLSAFAILVTLIGAKQAGEEAVIATFVLAQLVTAAVLDHFGWLGVKHVPLNAWRIAGAVVVFIGVVMMQRK